MTDAETVSEKLNRLFELDPEAVERFVEMEVEVNDEVAETEHFVVSGVVGGGGPYVLRPVGLINGLLADEERRVCRCYDTGSGDLVGFSTVSIEEVTPDE